jgi:hypothetical protein
VTEKKIKSDLKESQQEFFMISYIKQTHFRYCLQTFTLEKKIIKHDKKDKARFSDGIYERSIITAIKSSPFDDQFITL